MKQPQSYAKIKRNFHMISVSYFNFFDYLSISTNTFKDDPVRTVQGDFR